MKFSILLDILMDVLQQRKVTAQALAEKHEISTRSVYRYVDELSLSIPIYIKRGRDGGIFLSDHYKLPVGFFTKEEYEATVDALDATYAQLPEERFLSAKAKLNATRKTSATDGVLPAAEDTTMLIDGGTWGDTKKFADKLRYMVSCIHDRQTIEIEYRDRLGAPSIRKIQPHVVILKQNVWYVYAFCLKQRAFRLFRLGRIFAAFATGETFTRRHFQRDDIPLNFWIDESESLPVRLQIEESALLDAQDWLGGENVKKAGEKWVADVTLPNDESLVRKIVGFGEGVTVLSPAFLKEKVRDECLRVAKLYE